MERHRRLDQLMLDGEARKRFEMEAAWCIHRGGRPRPIWRTPELRWRLAEAQNWRCCWCFASMEPHGNGGARATFEHIVPLSCDGPDILENVVIACAQCNHSRGSTLDELMRVAVLFGVEV